MRSLLLLVVASVGFSCAHGSPPAETPNAFSPGVNDLSFTVEGDRLAAHLHLPATYKPGQLLPVVVVTGAWLTVKEQMATTYARALAERGYAALTFDHRGFGASEGTPRQFENPTRKIRDLVAATELARRLPVSDGREPAMLAVCFAANYGAHAIVEGAPVRAFATVAAWFHDRDSQLALFGAEEVERRYRVGREAAELYARTGEVITVPAESATNREAAMVGVEYYQREDRGMVPTWVNEMAVMSWPEYLDVSSLRIAPRIRVPTLVVHSDGSGLPAHAKRFEAALGGEHALLWLEGEHTQFYDEPTRVSAAADAVAAHFRRAMAR